MDKLIDGLNKKYIGKASFFYSTPNDYMEVIKSLNYTWPTKSDDFFPYADNAHAYWTGYYTSRPTLKRFVRDSGAYYRAAQNFMGHYTLLNLVPEAFHSKAQ